MAQVEIDQMHLIRILNTDLTFSDILEIGLAEVEKNMAQAIEREIAQKLYWQIEKCNFESKNYSVEYLRRNWLVTFEAKVSFDFNPFRCEIKDDSICISDQNTSEMLPYNISAFDMGSLIEEWHE
jgi:hypothetical protein